MSTTAGKYETTDKELAEDINKRTFPESRHDGSVRAAGFREAPPPPGGAGDMSSGDINAIDKANRTLLNDMENEYRHLPDGQVKTE